MSGAFSRFSDDPPPVEFEAGDRMTRLEFHRVYERMPENARAELIGGIVYVPSPLKRSHTKSHLQLGALLSAYVCATGGTEAGDNATILLSDEDEPQPDLFLRILPEYGGQSRTSEDDYILGAPELIIEVSHSSRSLDLHAKKQRYSEAGVIEYTVCCLFPKTVYWFDFKTGTSIAPDADGVFRSIVFPGLWIHGESLLSLNYEESLQWLNSGLNSPEHAQFVRRLADR